MDVPHQIFQSQEFLDSIGYIEGKVDKKIAARIKRDVKDKLETNPTMVTKRIQMDSQKPKRVLRVGDWRVFFLLCEECKKEGYESRWGCPGCGTEIPVNSVVLKEIERRKNSYDF